MRTRISLLLVLLSPSLFSQVGKKMVTGVLFSSGYADTYYGVVIGLEHRKAISQINIFNGLGSHIGVPGLWEYSGNIRDHYGLGYNLKFFPNKKHSLFTSFLEGDISMMNSRIHRYGSDTSNHEWFPAKVTRRIATITVGYGIGLSLFHHFFLSTSFRLGHYWINGSNFYYANKVLVSSYPYKDNDFDMQMSFSLLYCIGRFK
jgi:hypothetical protein